MQCNESFYTYILHNWLLCDTLRIPVFWIALLLALALSPLRVEATAQERRAGLLVERSISPGVMQWCRTTTVTASMRT